jgi:hypothetical protein
MLGANLEDFTIDQFAGALALSLGAVGSLLLVIWQSKCHCKINLCYLFTCERKPPPDALPKDLKDKDNKNKKKGDIETAVDDIDDVDDIDVPIEVVPLSKKKLAREAEEMDLEYVSDPI